MSASALVGRVRQMDTGQSTEQLLMDGQSSLSPGLFGHYLIPEFNPIVINYESPASSSGHRRLSDRPPGRLQRPASSSVRPQPPSIASFFVSVFLTGYSEERKTNEEK